jgi:NADH/F420H2 dehydrogenase subunit C
VETCRALRDNEALRFTTIIEVTAADYVPRTPRFEVVYHLLSISRRDRLRIKVRVADGGTVPSVQGVWKGAGWPEREVWDMFGIVFDGHPDLRRLLMPEDWEGHPGRKDYPVQKSASTSSAPTSSAIACGGRTDEEDEPRRPRRMRRTPRHLWVASRSSRSSRASRLRTDG